MRLGVLACLALALPACSAAVDAVPPEVPDGIPAGAHDVLAEPDSLEILALDPNESQDAPGTFHGYPILGRATLAAAAERTSLMSLVYRGIRESDGIAALCFLPRHGIRATRGAETIDFLICYECFQLEVHGAGAPRTQLTTSSSPEPSVSALYRGRGLSIHGD